MQQRGAQCLDAITEEDVLSFFLAEDGSLQRSCSYKKNIAAVFKAGLNWKAAQCRKVLSFLPVLRENRKNIQYLTQDEVRLLREAAEKAKFLHVIGRFSSCSFLRGFGVVTSPGLLSIPLTGKLNGYWLHSRKHPYP